MENQWLLLWFEAPLQSWGYDSKFSRRDTLEFPTKSGVLGLLLCAMGASGEQRELLGKFATLKQTVLSFKRDKPRNSLLHDFQMIGAGYDSMDVWKGMMIPRKADGNFSKDGAGKIAGSKMTHRYYLQNAVFAVLLEVPSGLADETAHALQNPVYPIYLGRRCCVPTEFVYQGNFNSAEDAEKKAMNLASEKSLKLDFRVIDGELDDGDVFTLNDVPLQFGTQKMYRDRRVTKIMETA